MRRNEHLLVTPDSVAGISRMMQSVGRRYVRYFNTRHASTGTLWEGRFRATLIESERYLLTCSSGPWEAKASVPWMEQY